MVSEWREASITFTHIHTEMLVKRGTEWWKHNVGSDGSTARAVGIKEATVYPSLEMRERAMTKKHERKQAGGVCNEQASHAHN